MHRHLLNMGFVTKDKHTYEHMYLGIVIVIANGAIDVVTHNDVVVPNIVNIRDIQVLITKEYKAYGGW